MKVNTHVQDVTRSGVKAESTFTIKSTAKAFDILSRKLYSDPLAAIVRELSCNAYDAHVAAGKADIPFEIHLPNQLEPWFSVKDFGTGLSDEDIHGMYTSFFDSTKADSNDFIGYLGLGSKSPLSYSKNFEVISRFDGKKTVYSVFVNENGVPSVATLATFDTIEPNGLEVKIAIEKNDFSAFRERTAKELRFFSVKPVVVGYPNFQFEDMPAETIKGNGYWIARSNSYRNKITAVQGNVAYFVDVSALDTSRANREFISRHEVVIFFNIGELEVAASREEIHYEENTIRAISDRLNAIRLDWLQSVDKEAEQASTNNSKFDAFVAFQQNFGQISCAADLKTISEGYTFKTKLLQEWITSRREITAVTPVEKHAVTFYTMNYRSTLVSGRHSSHGVSVRPASNFRVVFVDVRVRFAARISSYIHKLKSEGVREPTIIAIKPLKFKDKDDKAVVAERVRLIRELGNPTVVNLSDVSEDLTVTKKAKGVAAQFKTISDNSARSRARPIFRDCLSAPSKGVYIVADYHLQIIHSDNDLQWTHNTLLDMVNVMLKVVNLHNTFTLGIEDVYVVSKRTAKNLDKGWSSLFDMYLKSRDSIQDAIDFNARRSHTADPLDIFSMVNHSRSGSEFCKKVTLLLPTSPFRQAVEAIVDAQNKTSKISDVEINRITVLDATLGIKRDKDAKPLFDSSTLSQYRMVHHCDFQYGMTQTEIDDLIDYVALVDGK